MIRPLLALVLLLALPPAADAQRDELDRVEALLAAGDYARARSELERWWQRADGRDAGRLASGKPHALLLRARLAREPRAAQDDYLTLVLGHPTSPYAAEALLRLGQELLAEGETARAIGYLERLAADYPGAPQRPLGLLWLARAQRAAGHAELACTAAQAGLGVSGGEGELQALLHVEDAAACRLPAPTPPLPEQKFTVQLGAFRELGAAEKLAARATSAGFQARVVSVPRSSLIRVRTGRFAAASEASALARRLRAAGFTAIVVDDASLEVP